ncbi:MAG: diguanylate cyclase [Lysobacteraceae bacterium]
MDCHPRLVYWPRNPRDRDEAFNLSDMITGIPQSRALLDALIRSAWPRCAASSPNALLLLDIDGLGRINRLLGRRAGDAVVEQLTREICKATIPVGYCLGHCGGRMLLLMPETTLAKAIGFSAELRHRLRLACGAARTISVGVASTRGRRPLILLREAARALHRAKAGGGDRIGVMDTDPSAPASWQSLSAPARAGNG